MSARGTNCPIVKMTVASSHCLLTAEQKRGFTGSSAIRKQRETSAFMLLVTYLETEVNQTPQIRAAVSLKPRGRMDM